MIKKKTLVNSSRIHRLRTLLAKEGLGAFLVTNLKNICYLVGYTGSNGLLVVKSETCEFYSDFRYKEQSAQEVRGARVRIVKGSLLEAAAKESGLRRMRRIGFESNDLRVSAYHQLRKILAGRKLLPKAGLVEKLRRIKDEEEITRMRRAAGIADRAFAEVCQLLRPGMKEQEVANELDHRMRRMGAQRVAFETIVASGPNGALPHARPGERRIRSGDLVVFDLGAVWKEYCSDMTRTVSVGRASRKQREMYDLVLRAQRAGVHAVAHGANAAEADRASRQIIEEKGLGPAFGHGLGHGVGLEVHEAPGLNSKSKEHLETGMVVTVEPGIYLANWGGIRIEDLVVVRNGRPEILTRTPKELIVI